MRGNASGNFAKYWDLIDNWPRFQGGYIWDWQDKALTKTLPDGAIAPFVAARLAMAEQLVATMTAEFDPAAFHDEYREALMAVIEAKATGAEIAEPVAAPAAGLTDLMAALEASVAAAKAARQADAPEPMVVAAGKKRSRVAAAKAAARVAAAESEAEAAPVRHRKSA